MSVKSEDSDTKFRKWKEDITKRCNDHVAKHPEFKPLTTPPKADTLKKSDVLRVEVCESKITTGCWYVMVNGHVERSFFGALAHQKATRCAADLLKEEIEEVGSDQAGTPDPCIFCGTRYIHRTDCPHNKKEGPDFTV